jgi:hypothetical protein
VQQARQLQDGYYRSAAWRSGYEWRMDDAMALASGATTAEADAAAAAAVPHYSWQDTATARAFIEANKKLEERKARILAGEILDDPANGTGTTAATSQQQRRQTPSQQQQQQSQQPVSPSQAASNPSNRVPDSLDQFHAEATTSGSNGHVSPFHQTQQPQQQQFQNSGFGDQQQFSNNGYQLTHFGGGGNFGTSNGASTTRSTRRRNAGEPVAVLAGVPVTARQFQRPNETAASRTLAAQGALTARSRAPVRSTDGANFQLRGAGALPTHRATTHGTLMRLAATSQSHNGASKGVIAQDPLAHQSNWDLSSWGADVQRNLARAKGTLATQRPQPAGTR